jgi:riboflavin synthase alpha subunit
MFTGIVRELGRVAKAERNGGGLELRIEAPEIAPTVHPGDSVAVAGVCLTVTAVTGDVLEFDAVPETLARTNLPTLQPGAEINLEPALRAGEPLGGHFVQGHVDGTARVEALEAEGEGARLRLGLRPELLRYCVEKGSLAVDGVSLTIAALRDDGVEIALVPFTLEHTTLAAAEPGDELNVEVDLLAKYAERLARA